MNGDRKAGFTVFWADDGLDTGPILLQKETDVDISDTVDSLYSRFLYPEGIRAMVSIFMNNRDGGRERERKRERESERENRWKVSSLIFPHRVKLFV